MRSSGIGSNTDKEAEGDNGGRNNDQEGWEGAAMSRGDGDREREDQTSRNLMIRWISAGSEFGLCSRYLEVGRLYAPQAQDVED